MGHNMTEGQNKVYTFSLHFGLYPIHSNSFLICSGMAFIPYWNVICCDFYDAITFACCIFGANSETSRVQAHTESTKRAM